MRREMARKREREKWDDTVFLNTCVWMPMSTSLWSLWWGCFCFTVSFFLFSLVHVPVVECSVVMWISSLRASLLPWSSSSSSYTYIYIYDDDDDDDDDGGEAHLFLPHTDLFFLFVFQSLSLSLWVCVCVCVCVCFFLYVLIDFVSFPHLCCQEVT